MKHVFRIVSKRSRDITNYIFLSLSYVVGIGISSIVGKLSGKRFLDMSPKKSTWVRRSTDSGWEHMY